MLRTLRHNRLNPVLMGWSTTSTAAPAATFNYNGADFSTITSGSSADVDLAPQRAFARTPLVFGNGYSADVTANTQVTYDSTNMAKNRIKYRTATTGGVDPGTCFPIALGWRSPDATKYRKDQFEVLGTFNKPRVLAFKITTTSPTIDIGGRHATIVKNGTGDVTLTFLRPFGNANYSAAITPIADAFRGAIFSSSTAKAPNTLRLALTNSAGAAADGSIYLVVYGDDSRANYARKLRPVQVPWRSPRLIAGQLLWTAGVPALSIGTGETSSMTDSGTGDVLFSYADPFAREPIAIVSANYGFWPVVSPSLPTNKSQIQFKVYNSGGALADPTSISFMIFGSDDANDY